MFVKFFLQIINKKDSGGLNFKRSRLAYVKGKYKVRRETKFFLQNLVSVTRFLNMS